MINIAILGFGVVGSGVAEVLKQNADSITQKLSGEKINIKYILDKRTFPDHELGDRVTTDFEKIVSDPEIVMIVETMGGSHPAYDFSKQAICAGKNVVTSNKEVVANYGTELLELAKSHSVNYLFEASVGGGIPIIRPMWECLAANKIQSVTGILNGTTNFILTKMIEEGMDFDEALSLAQCLGYAEANPAADVEGMDTCRKICILASLAFGTAIDPKNVHCEGITKISSEDVAAAETLGYSIKLLGKAEKRAEGTYIITAPHLVGYDNPMSGVRDVYNAITVCGNAVGDVMFYGRGAGKLPTASAVVSDIIDIARVCKEPMTWTFSDEDTCMDHKNAPVRFFVRTNDPNAKDYFAGCVFCDCEDGTYAFITDEDTEFKLSEKLNNISVLSAIRVL
ncbi:MAG: homoserine dehydrogenase [Clostridia bacterium]|nr:homoserine dehydrogenase [Clostridia bacterium]